MFENCVSGPMANKVWLPGISGLWCWRPDLTGLLITQIQCFASWISDRIVRPGCQPVFTTIDCPGRLTPRLSNHETELWVTNYIYPGGRCFFTRLNQHMVFFSIR